MIRLPSLSARQVVGVLKRAGFVAHHQTGSHLFLSHPNRRATTTVPIHGEDLPRWLLKLIIRQAGLTEDQFREIL